MRPSIVGRADDLLVLRRDDSNVLGGPRAASFPRGDAEYEAVVEIETARLIRGELPPRAKALTLEWSNLHREELLANWELCARNQPPNRIRPLD